LRGQGLGGQLVDAALASWTPPAGAAVGLDATSLGAPLYRGKGVGTVAHIDRLVGALRGAEVGGDAAGFGLVVRGVLVEGEGVRPRRREARIQLVRCKTMVIRCSASAMRALSYRPTCRPCLGSTPPPPASTGRR